MIHDEFTDSSLGIMDMQQGFADSEYSFVLDYVRWGPLQQELDDWLEMIDMGATREGLLVCYTDPSFRLMFKLRWG